MAVKKPAVNTSLFAIRKQSSKLIQMNWIVKQSFQTLGAPVLLLDNASNKIPPSLHQLLCTTTHFVVSISIKKKNLRFSL